MSALSPDPPDAAAVSEEDVARAATYALLARLFYAPPDAALLHAIADHAGSGGDAIAATPLTNAWRELGAAAAVAAPGAVQDEYDNVFVGTGKAEITLYASHYLRLTEPNGILVGLRAELAGMGLGRRQASEPEDHLSALCDVMRHLILRPRSIGVHAVAAQQERQLQQRFFIGYISHWYAEFCISVAASSKTDFYKHVATFCRVFFEVETEAFELP